VPDDALAGIISEVKKKEWGAPARVHQIETRIEMLEQQLTGYPPAVWERLRRIEWAQVRLNLADPSGEIVLADICPQCWTFVLPGTITNQDGDTKTYKTCHVDWHEKIGW
jgi:hypothetical protein